jgi:hypothetical protein
MTDTRSPFDYPLVSGQYEMTDDWTISLPGKFRRRFEEGSLVLWRPGITAWISVWGNDNNTAQRERLLDRRSRISSEAFNIVEEEGLNLLRFSYRLDEAAEDNRVPALYGFIFGPNGDVQMGIYFDSECDLPDAEALWRGVHERGAA